MQYLEVVEEENKEALEDLTYNADLFIVNQEETITKLNYCICTLYLYVDLDRSYSYWWGYGLIYD